MISGNAVGRQKLYSVGVVFQPYCLDWLSCLTPPVHTQVDPGFVDMKAENFAFKKDAQIFKDFPGFPDIPFAQIGPQRSTGHRQRAG